MQKGINTMRDKILKVLNEKRSQLKKLNESMINSDSKEERAAIGDTMKKLRDEINDLEEVLNEMDKPAGSDNGNGSHDGNDSGNDAHNGEIVVEGDDDVVKDSRKLNVLATMRSASNPLETNAQKKAEARAQKFAANNKMTINNVEARSVLVSSGKIATPTEVSGINDMFNTVSSIVDLVKVTDASGMGAYKVAFQKTNAAADNQTEGGTYNSSDPSFDFVTITPETQSVLSYISKQVQKQTPLNYEAKVRESALIALRKSAQELITTKIVASTLNTAITATAIDDKTLRTIAFNYGGDENIMGGAVLFLNKKDLIKFGDVRGNNKQAVYEITPDTANPNTGVIKDGGLSVKYCINSDLTEGTLIYGQPAGFELALFSDYDVRVSEDFAFDKGLLAIRGDVELGGDVVKQDGFVKLTVSAE